MFSNNQSRATLWILDTCLQLTIQEHLCEFLTHVSSWDFVFSLSFWSQLHCVQNCTAETYCEKNVCFWKRDPPHSLGQPSVFWWHVGSWFRNQEPPQFPGGWYVWVEFCHWFNVNLRSRTRNPSIRSPASKEITSKFVELCETEVRLLHIQLVGTNVLLAKSESWNKSSLQCCSVFPTWQ